MIGFDALVLSKAAGAQVGQAKIIHGDHWSVFKVRISAVSRDVGKVVGKITVTLSPGINENSVTFGESGKCLA